MGSLTALMMNAELGRIWAKHYPNRHNDHVSSELCTLVCSLVRHLARIEIGCGTPSTRLANILNSTGIATEQFEEWEAEKEAHSFSWKAQQIWRRVARHARG